VQKYAHFYNLFKMHVYPLLRHWRHTFWNFCNIVYVVSDCWFQNKLKYSTSYFLSIHQRTSGTSLWLPICIF